MRQQRGVVTPKEGWSPVSTCSYIPLGNRLIEREFSAHDIHGCPVFFACSIRIETVLISDIVIQTTFTGSSSKAFLTYLIKCHWYLTSVQIRTNFWIPTHSTRQQLYRAILRCGCTLRGHKDQHAQGNESKYDFRDT